MDRNIFLTADRFPLVRDIGRNRTEGLYTHPDRLLEYDVFLFVVEGSMQVIEEGIEYVVGENEHLFLKKGLHHWGKPETLLGTAWYWIHFTSPIDERIEYKHLSVVPELENYFSSHYQYVLQLPKFGAAALNHSTEDALKSMIESYRKKRTHRMTEISVQAYQLFLNLHQKAESREHANNKADAHVSRILEYLNSHAEEDFNSKQLSEHMSLNYSYISATFAKQTGQTVIEAHTRLRINKALHLMRTTSLNVSEISDQLGFQNPFYFTRVFKKILGEPPSSYMNHLYR
ncbi:helix-turn-helix transcriptional regulator [Paenibacillus sp. IB182493]|uniref:Helix-turn-helix transcriptional regulator n=1 Tax=Paenibacillus arenilitoris TaxID=2772299 RepID=A0A927CI11_9BACL|nr:helix-turn-helix transcriptional regulator [Paenibacillus arenilitoris]